MCSDRDEEKIGDEAQLSVLDWYNIIKKRHKNGDTRDGEEREVKPDVVRRGGLGEEDDCKRDAESFEPGDFDLPREREGVDGDNSCGAHDGWREAAEGCVAPNGYDGCDMANTGG